jgi:predicted ATPase/SAM-dependent methyltransferase
VPDQGLCLDSRRSGSLRFVRITELDVALGVDAGLQRGVMRPLTDLVILAGPNGAGKSRVLALINEVLSDPNLANADSLKAAVANHDRLGEKSPYHLDQIREWRKTLERAARAKFDPEFKHGRVFEFFPKAHALVDHRRMNEATQKQAAKTVQGLGLQNLEHNALAYVASVERRWFAATHQELAAAPEVKQDAIEARRRLGDLVQEFLGVRPALDLEQQPLLFGRPIAEARLSHGQSVLLQVAVALHAQGSQLDGLVLLLDEPECHLHPASIVDAIQRLRSFNKIGQIWMATHSVPVLAAMPTESVWYVSEGRVAWAGRRPEVVLESLLGGPAGRERMEDFLRLPAQFAASRFAAECLIPPKVVNTESDDPQAKQLREFCEIKVGSSGSLRLLDFGAGQGRLLSAMHERWEHPSKFAEAIDYRAFEPFPDASAQLTQNVRAIYPVGSTQRVFRRTDELSVLDAASVDVIVMCNVLHEVPPEEWRHLFGAESLFSRLLKRDGHVLILEDMEIPIGEKAHRFGFLLLDNPHLHKLMKCSEADVSQIQSFEARSGRLRAHAIPAQLLGRTDRNSTLEALSLLQETATIEIGQLRTGDPTSRNGRLHAMWTQLLANAYLGLKAL